MRLSSRRQARKAAKKTGVSPKVARERTVARRHRQVSVDHARRRSFDSSWRESARRPRP